MNESLTNGKEVTITTYPEGGKVKIDGGLEVSTPYKGTLVYGTHKIIGMPVTQGYKETPVDISIAPDGDNSFIIALISNNLNNTFTDPRDNKTYKTVKIGNQVWMAENLNYTGNNSYQRSITDKSQWESNMAYDGWCYYDNNSSNGSKYGVLYQWKAALKACPDGWHLPSDAEWTQFTDFVGGEINAGTKLKSKTGWRKNGNGTDDYGFTALPGGCRGSNGYFGSMGSDGNWWSSTEDFEDYPDSRDMSCNYANVGRSYYSKGCGFSVRCVRDL
ncbi:MAG: hypothetical protein BWY70_01429 [Bacteroidetes bacterium ADurb.Bin408]|nr:MAG: hypothetical protein BWY70_01429 [Bacteroidetes bacterium ADurb.Bin408]